MHLGLGFSWALMATGIKIKHLLGHSVPTLTVIGSRGPLSGQSDQASVLENVCPDEVSLCKILKGSI